MHVKQDGLTNCYCTPLPLPNLHSYDEYTNQNCFSLSVKGTYYDATQSEQTRKKKWPERTNHNSKQLLLCDTPIFVLIHLQHCLTMSSHRYEHPPWTCKLIDEWLRKRGRSRADMDGIVWASLRPT